MHKILVLLLVLFVCSCKDNSNKTSVGLLHPKVVEARGYVVPKDSMAQPKVVLVDESKLKKVPVGKPKVVMGGRI